MSSVEISTESRGLLKEWATENAKSIDEAADHLIQVGASRLRATKKYGRRKSKERKIEAASKPKKEPKAKKAKSPAKAKKARSARKKHVEPEQAAEASESQASD